MERLHDSRCAGKLLSLCHHVSPTVTLNIIKEDPDDNRILECAATAGSDFVVSEDKDLLRLHRLGDARTVTIQQFLEVMATQPK